MNKCVQCSAGFEVTPDDLAFYEKISVPPPTLCRDCRLQRRGGWRNERFVYPRVCGKCAKSVVSVFAEAGGIPVYCNACWWSDQWDARDFGRDFDFNRPFFDQLSDLLRAVPQLAIQNDDGIGSVNCQYCQDFAYGKNCYFVVGTWYTEDSFYCNINASYNKCVCDCTNVSKSELAYECTDSQTLYNCIFLQKSENCHDCAFGYDLKGCRDCFGCVGLRQKQFYFFNEPYSEADYKKKVAEFERGSYEHFEKMKAGFAAWSLKFPRRAMNLQNCENSVGNDLFNCRNTYGFSLRDSENARYCDQGDINKFSYDIVNSGRPEWCYEGVTPDDSYMTNFSWFSWKNRFCNYAFNCHNSESLFACASLHRAKYCILNKQYTKEEYEALVPKIIEHMRAAGEWGEFAPLAISFFGYNETMASEYFPLSEADARARGWKWQTQDPRQNQSTSAVISDRIQDAPDSLAGEVLGCVSCGKNYKVIPQELAHYRKMTLPVPRKCYLCRHSDRIARRTPYHLWDRQCAKCSAAIQTSYAPDRPEVVICETCYLKEVY